jgi:DMSO reductase family type II enzyme chaperone
MYVPVVDPEQRCAAYQYFADAFRYPEADAVEERQQLEYLTSFDCSAYKGACSLHEAAYTTEGQEVLYEELTRFYEFFGLSRDQHAELPDHLSVELEFMHFLSYLETQSACSKKETDSLFKAQRDFVGRHLQLLVTGITENLPQDSMHYRELLNELQFFLESEQVYLPTN